MSTRTSKSLRAGLQFPVTRTHRRLKEGEYAERVAETAAVYLAAVTEYLVAEVLELSGIVAEKEHKKRIKPTHIDKAIRDDEELNALLAHVSILQGGDKPYIQEALLKSIKPAAQRLPSAAAGSHQAPAVEPNQSAAAGIQGHVVGVNVAPPAAAPAKKKARANGTKRSSAATGKTKVTSAVKKKATGPAPKKKATVPGQKSLQVKKAARKAYQPLH